MVLTYFIHYFTSYGLGGLRKWHYGSRHGYRIPVIN